jgi:hypothetical protein
MKRCSAAVIVKFRQQEGKKITRLKKFLNGVVALALDYFNLRVFSA